MESIEGAGGRSPLTTQKGPDRELFCLTILVDKDRFRVGKPWKTCKMQRMHLAKLQEKAFCYNRDIDILNGRKDVDIGRGNMASSKYRVATG